MAIFENPQNGYNAFNDRKNGFVCNFVGKIFTRKDNLKRHKHKRCKKMATVLAEQEKDNKLEELQSKLEILEENY